MTPKEKAEELVYRHITLFKHYDANPKLNIGLNKYFKKCALIAVDEIMKQCWDYRDIDLQASYDYWQEVKQEIINF